MFIYEDEEDTVVFIYYLSNKLYAWTTSKKDRDKFESVRNMKLFKRKKKVLEPIEFHAFAAKYKDQQIISIPLEHDGKVYMIYGTYQEDTEVSYKIDEYIDFMNNIELLIHYMESEIPSKYRKAIRELSKFYTKNKDEDDKYHLNANFDTLMVFYKIFHNTFSF